MKEDVKELLEILDQYLESIINCIGPPSTLCEQAHEQAQKARARLAEFREKYPIKP